VSELAPYERLHRLGELELEHAGRGELAEVEKIQEERAALIATLPPTAPPAARVLLERTLALQQRTTIDLTRGREQILRSLATVRVGRQAAAGYGASTGPRLRREELA
jgi:hypothetical protein